jgi:hypothetical protein
VIPSTKVICSQCQANKDDGMLLTRDDVMRLNQGVWTMDHTTVNQTATWWFHGGNVVETLWIRYDDECTVKLEQAYHSFLSLQEDKSNVQEKTIPEKTNESPSREIVSLMGGKYQVNLRTMEQINTTTFFPRLVKRQIS